MNLKTNKKTNFMIAVSCTVSLYASAPYLSVFLIFLFGGEGSCRKKCLIVLKVAVSTLFCPNKVIYMNAVYYESAQNKFVYFAERSSRDSTNTCTVTENAITEQGLL